MENHENVISQYFAPPLGFAEIWWRLDGCYGVLFWFLE